MVLFSYEIAAVAYETVINSYGSKWVRTKRSKFRMKRVALQVVGLGDLPGKRGMYLAAMELYGSKRSIFPIDWKNDCGYAGCLSMLNKDGGIAARVTVSLLEKHSFSSNKAAEPQGLSGRALLLAGSAKE
jgi:hypothetical protein